MKVLYGFRTITFLIQPRIHGNLLISYANTNYNSMRYFCSGELSMMHYFNGKLDRKSNKTVCIVLYMY